MPILNNDATISNLNELNKTIDNSPVGPNFIIPPPVDNNTSGWGETFHSAFDTSNSIGSFIANNNFKSTKNNQNILNFNPYKHFFNPLIQPESEPYVKAYSDVLSHAHDPQELALTIHNIKLKHHNSEVLSHAGWFKHAAAELAAGALDPVFYIPILDAIKPVEELGIVGKALLSAGEMAGSQTVDEAALHYTQIHRSVKQSLYNIGGAALFGGMLGGTAKLISKANIGDGTNIMNDVVNNLGDSAKPNNVASDVGAGAVTQEDNRLLPALGLNHLPISAMQRMDVSPAWTVRKLVARLVPDPLYKRMHLEGKSHGADAQTRIKLWSGQLVFADKELLTQFKDYSLRMKAENSRAVDLTEFKKMVSNEKAGIESGIPEVVKSANEYDKRIFGPAGELLDKHFKNKDHATLRSNYNAVVWDKAKILKNPNEFVDQIKQEFIKDDPEITDDQAQELANNVRDTLLGTDSGLMRPNQKVYGRRGSMNERMINLPFNSMQNFKINDITHIAHSYVHSMIPSLVLKDMGFSDLDMKGEISDIAEEYQQLINKVNSSNLTKAEKAKKVSKLIKSQKQDKQDLQDLRDKILNQFGDQNHNANDIFFRGKNMLLKYNFMTDLGKMTISAASDLSRYVMVHGVMDSMHGIRLLAIAKTLKGVPRNDLTEMSIGIDLASGSTRFNLIADLNFTDAPLSNIERLQDKAVHQFTKMTLMDRWNDFVKTFAGLGTMNRFIRDITKLAQGKKISKLKLANLSRAGIDEKDIDQIYKMIEAHGQNHKGFMIANLTDWKDPWAKAKFSAAVLKTVDEIINTPFHGAMPTVLSKGFARLIAQFKSFTFTHYLQGFIPMLQMPHAGVAVGMILSTVFGSLSVELKAKLGGYPPPTTLRGWIVQSMDQGGAMSMLFMLNGIVDSSTQHKISINSLLGIGRPSRYNSISPLGAIMGPSASTMINLKSVAYGLEKKWTEHQTHAARKLIWGQNLWFATKIFNDAENKINSKLGIKKRDFAH